MTLSEAERETAAGHLNYEVQMMTALCGWTIRLGQPRPTVLSNAALEAMLVHIRLLIEFLEGRPDKKDRRIRHWSTKDIRPKDFVSDWTGSSDGRLDGYLELADQHLAHLSLARTKSPKGAKWVPDRMVNAVLDEFEAFTQAAERSGSPFAVIFRAAVSARQLIANPPAQWPAQSTRK